jgi:hypothetical protein
MTVTLTAEEKAALERKAADLGVSVEALVRQAVLEVIGPLTPPVSPGEFNRMFDEIAEMIPEGTPPIPDEALRRENFEYREDDWNRH